MKSMQLKGEYPPIQIESVNQAFVEIILGRPSADCKHLGICKVERVYSNSIPPGRFSLCKFSNRIFGLASFAKGFYFELTFERNAISDTIFNEHFRSRIFRVEENYLIDSELMGTTINLSKGDYKIEFSNTLLSVRFEL